MASNQIIGFAFEVSFSASTGPETLSLTIDASTNAGAVGMFNDVDRAATATTAAEWNAANFVVGSNGFGQGSASINYTTPNYAGGFHRFAIYLEPNNTAGTFPVNITVTLACTGAATSLGIAVQPQVNILQGTGLGTSGLSNGTATLATSTVFPWYSCMIGGAQDEVQFEFTADFGSTATATARNIGLYGSAFSNAGFPPLGTGNLLFELYDITADGFSAPASLTLDVPSTGSSPFGGGEDADTWAVPAGRQGVHTFRVIIRGKAGMSPNLLAFFGVSFDGRLTLQPLTFTPATATPRIAITPSGSTLTTSPTALTASGGTPTVTYNWSFIGAVPTGVGFNTAGTTTATGANVNLVFGATTPASSVVTVRVTNGTGPELTEETYTLNFSGGGGGNTVSISATDAAAGEPANNGAWTITFSAATTVSTDVNFSLTGTATLGTDYTLSPSVGGIVGNTLTVPAGTTSVVVTLTVVDDGVAESTEDAVMTLTGATAGYTVGTPSNDDIVITDDDGGPVTPLVTISSSGSPSETGPTAGTYTLTATPAPAAPIQVNVAFSGTATNGTDYNVSGVTAGQVTIGVSGIATVTITPVDDTANEGGESAILTISAGTGYTPGTTVSASLTIADNDSGGGGGGGLSGGGGGGGGGCVADSKAPWMLALGLLALFGFALRMRSRRV